MNLFCVVNNTLHISSIAIAVNSSFRFEITDASSCELNMPTNWNQRLTSTFTDDDGNLKDTWIFAEGCGACCKVDVNAYYAGYPLSLDYKEWDKKSVNWLPESFATFSPVPNNDYRVGIYENEKVYNPSAPAQEQETYFKRIKKELIQGRPVILHCVGVNGETHWVVAYKYVKADSANATQADCIWVLDPANSIGKPKGQAHSLVDAIKYSFGGNYNLNNAFISRIIITGSV